jgi:hypothetical protein
MVQCDENNSQGSAGCFYPVGGGSLSQLGRLSRHSGGCHIFSSFHRMWIFS